MARLQEQLLERIERFADRVLDVAAELDAAGVSWSCRIVDQLIGSGTSVGANVFEADEAMSRPDFVKCLCIASKELNETRFWVRMIARGQWLKPARLAPPLAEIEELRKILGTMISRTKKSG